MIRGTLQARMVRCGKAGCACATDPARRHGPYWYLVWRDGGRLRKWYVPARKLALVRAAVEGQQALRRAMRQCEDDLRISRELMRALRLPLLPLLRMPTMPSLARPGDARAAEEALTEWAQALAPAASDEPVVSQVAPMVAERDGASYGNFGVISCEFTDESALWRALSRDARTVQRHGKGRRFHG